MSRGPSASLPTSEVTRERHANVGVQLGALCWGRGRKARPPGHLSPARAAGGQERAAHRVRTGMTCRQAGDESTACDYTVGRSLAFQIPHVGLPDALVLI